MMYGKLIRIPLQFFGAAEEAEDEDLFEEDYDEEEEDEDYDGDEETDEYDEDSDEGKSDGKGDGEDAKADGGEDDSNAELIKLLKAQGYVGDDLKTLTADMKRKEEDKAKKAASGERRAAMQEGKSHIKSGKPQRGMSGSGMDAFSQKDIREVSACLVRRGTTNQGQRAVNAIERRVRAASK